MFYRLNHHCRLVRGAARGAIYDFQTGKVYSINRGASDMLEFCQNQALEDIFDMTSPANGRYLSFLDTLTAKGIGAIYCTEPPAVVEAPVEQDVKLDFLWLELTGKCNNKCLHCYATSGPAAIETDPVPFGRWLNLIAEAKQAGADAIQLIGGEPLLYPHWRDLVLKARKEGFGFIEIFTNATLIDHSCIEFFKENEVNVATTIYADNAATHDRVTLHPGSFAKTLTAAKELLRAGIPLRIASIIMKANENEAENIMNLYRDLGVEVVPPDIVRPTGRGDDKELLPSAYTKPPISPPFYTDSDSFAKAHYYHSCLAGKIAVTSDGDVIPCIFARNQICGNILSQSLNDVLSGHALQQCWRTTKDHVEKCKDCEYRYACSDCRPLAQGSDSAKRWLACSTGCSYNPYTGKWEE